VDKCSACPLCRKASIEVCLVRSLVFVLLFAWPRHHSLPRFLVGTDLGLSGMPGSVRLTGGNPATGPTVQPGGERFATFPIALIRDQLASPAAG